MLETPYTIKHSEVNALICRNTSSTSWNTTNTITSIEKMEMNAKVRELNNKAVFISNGNGQYDVQRASRLFETALKNIICSTNGTFGCTDVTLKESSNLRAATQAMPEPLHNTNNDNHRAFINTSGGSEEMRMLGSEISHVDIPLPREIEFSEGLSLFTHTISIPTHTNDFTPCHESASSTPLVEDAGTGENESIWNSTHTIPIPTPVVTPTTPTLLIEDRQSMTVVNKITPIRRTSTSTLLVEDDGRQSMNDMNEITPCHKNLTPKPLVEDEDGESESIWNYLASCHEAIVCYNIGVCHIISEQENQQQAQNYFHRAKSAIVATRRSSLFSKTRRSSNDTKPIKDFKDVLDYIRIAILHNQGLIHFRSKKHKKAIQCYTEAKDLAIATYGVRHVYVAHALNSTGVAILASVRATQNPALDETASISAINCIGQSLSIVADILRQHTEDDAAARKECLEMFATMKHNIANVKLFQQECDEACPLFEEAYQIRRRVLGDHHPDTINSAFHVGQSLHYLGKYEDALRYYKVFIMAISPSSSTADVSSKLLSKTTVLMIQKIAWAFHQDRLFSHANSFYDLAHKAATNVLSKNDKVVARILNQWGNLHYECGDMVSALNLYIRGLRIEHDSHSHIDGRTGTGTTTMTNNDDPTRHLDTLTTMSNIASAFENVGRYKASLAYLNKMMDILSSDSITEVVTSSRINQSIVEVTINMARVQAFLGRFDLALKSLEEALRMRREQCGHLHPAVAVVLNEMGIVQGKNGQMSSALESFEECLRIRQLSDNSHSQQGNISTVLYNIARVHIHDGNYSDALIRLKELTGNELLRREIAANNGLDYASANANANANANRPSPVMLLNALEETSQILHEHFHNPREALFYLEKGIRVIIEESASTSNPDPRTVHVHEHTRVPYPIHSRLLGLAGKACLALGYKDRATSFFIRTMRINIAGGLAFDANITSMGFDCEELEEEGLPAAPAA